MISRSHFALFLVFSLCFAPIQAQPLPDRRPFLGRVTNEDGIGIEGATVALRRQDDSGSYAFWGEVAVTGKMGQFSFPDAEEGRYYLTVEAPGHAQLQNQTLNWFENSPVPPLLLQRLATAVFRVMQSDKPLANATVWARLKGDGDAGQQVISLRTNAEGKATLPNLVPARYSIHLMVPEKGFSIQNGVKISFNKTPIIKDFPLETGGALQIRALEQPSNSSENARPRGIGGATLALVPASPAEASRLMGDLADPGENMALLAVQNQRALLSTRDGDGTVELHDLAPGRYTARIQVPGQNAPPQPVEIVAGQTANLNFSLPTRPNPVAPLIIALRDTTGAPAPANREWLIRLLPVAKNGGLRPDDDDDDGPAPFFPGGNGGRRALSDENGQISLYPLKPNNFRVLVAARPENSAKTPDFTALDVTPDSWKTVPTLTLPAASFNP